MKTLKVSRKITSPNVRIDELKKWVGKEVDIIIMEKRTASEPDKKDKSAAGILQQYKNKKLREKESTAWASAAKEKYGNR